mmetsp:Transcript_1098/g.2862  ORF Transcript_1098/g.2862 Transcript_1098/m.2862 type:complete len:202 (+) Transcript_1098:1426-2031(+)
MEDSGHSSSVAHDGVNSEEQEQLIAARERRARRDARAVHEAELDEMVRAGSKSAADAEKELCEERKVANRRRTTSGLMIITCDCALVLYSMIGGESMKLLWEYMLSWVATGCGIVTACLIFDRADELLAWALCNMLALVSLHWLSVVFSLDAFHSPNLNFLCMVFCERGSRAFMRMLAGTKSTRAESTNSSLVASRCISRR